MVDNNRPDSTPEKDPSIPGDTTPAPAPPPAAAPPQPAAEAPQANPVLAALGYPIWIIALVIVLTDMKRDAYMRFHGWNALFWAIGYVVVMVAMGIVSAVLGSVPGLGALIGVIFSVVPLLFLVFSIVFAVKAYNRKDVVIPVITDMARKQSDKPV